jgi:hypothetical protein
MDLSMLLVFIIIKRQQELKEFCFEGRGFHPATSAPPDAR